MGSDGKGDLHGLLFSPVALESKQRPGGEDIDGLGAMSRRRSPRLVTQQRPGLRFGWDADVFRSWRGTLMLLCSR